MDLDEWLNQCWQGNDIRLKYLDIEAHAESIMVTVVWSVLSEAEFGQLWVGIPRVGMVDDASSDMSWILHMLLEAEVEEHGGHQISWLSLETHIEVASDDGRLLHVNYLLQLVDNIFHAWACRPAKISHDRKMQNFVRYSKK